VIKIINDLDTLFVGDLVFDDTITSRIKEEWNEFIKDKNSDSFYDGDIYCVTDIDDKIPLIKISKSKFSCLYYARKTNEITVRSLFSGGFITTSDNYVCIILNNRNNKLNAIGGMADNKDFINNKFDYYKCLVREFMEELGFDLVDDSNFDAILRFLKYPSGEELNKAYYPVGTLYEIKTNYTKDQLIDMFNKNKHDREVKELRFFNSNNYKEIYSYKSKTDYLDELFSILFR
jgi:8-oxo-dGTP pyrophosphatase MutT (NUDIX family)